MCLLLYKFGANYWVPHIGRKRVVFFFFLFTASSARFGCGLAKNSVQQRRSVVLKILSCVEIVANAIQIAGVQGNQC